MYANAVDSCTSPYVSLTVTRNLLYTNVFVVGLLCAETVIKNRETQVLNPFLIRIHTAPIVRMHAQRVPRHVPSVACQTVFYSKCHGLANKARRAVS